MADLWPETESDGFECPAELEDAIAGEEALNFSERFINYIKPHAELYIGSRTVPATDFCVELLAGDNARAS